MPLYEYKCSKCGNVFEVMQKFADEPLTSHDSCGGTVERLLSSPALQFKGSGWYITDYARGKGSGPANKPNGSSSGDSSAKSSSDSSSTSTPAPAPSTPSK